MIRPRVFHSVSSLSFLPGRRSSISIGSVTLPLPSSSDCTTIATVFT